MVRGWKDWVRGIAIWGIGPNDELTRIRTDERGYLQVLQVPHHHTHEDGGSDEINVQGLSGVLADLQRGKFSFVGNYADFPAPGEPERLAFAVDRLTIYRDTGAEWQKVATAHWDYLEGAPSDFFPAPHAETHEEGGSDAINPANIGANWNKLVNKPSTYPPSPHAASHQAGGADEINVQGLSGQLADYQKSRWDLVDGKPAAFPPSAHASTHQPGASDALPTAAPAPITEGATGSEGSSTALARADHVHETPAQWTPKEHGNEAHSLDFLDADGNTLVKEKVSGVAEPSMPVLGNFVLNVCPDRSEAFLFGPLCNALAFIVHKGGTVESNVPPDYGNLSDLFTGDGSYARWEDPSGTIVITLTLPGTWTWIQSMGACMLKDFGAKHVKFEYYDENTSSWVTYLEVTGNTKEVVAKNVYSSHIAISKFRWSFSDFENSSQFRLLELTAAVPTTGMFEYVLTKGGGDMYGDIDMYGNDIVNPGLVDGVDVSAHAARHEDGGADEINVQGLSGQLADPQKTTWDLVANKPSSFNPSAHGSRHEVGGSDEVRPGKYVNSLIFQTTQTTPSAYTSLSTGIGCRALVFLRIYNDSGATRVFYFQPGDETSANGDNTDATHALSPIWLENGKVAHTIMTTDSSGNLRWRADAAVTGVGVRVLAYIKLS